MTKNDNLINQNYFLFNSSMQIIIAQRLECSVTRPTILMKIVDFGFN